MSSLYDGNCVRTFGGVVFLTCLAAFAASASIIQNDATLPPENGGYVTPAQIHACFAAHNVCLDNGTHFGFIGASSTFDGAGQHEQFQSEFDGELFNGTNTTDMGPIKLFGPVGVTIFGRATPTQLGTFSTQMTLLHLTAGPVVIQLDPGQTTTGMTTVADNGGGTFRITSFFDVFTELSTDGGLTFEPATTGSSHVNLQPIPEPGTLGLTGLGALGLWLCFRKRSRRTA